MSGTLGYRPEIGWARGGRPETIRKRKYNSEEICSNWPKLAFAWQLIFAWWRVNLCYYLTGTHGQLVSAAGFDGNYWHPRLASPRNPWATLSPRVVVIGKVQPWSFASFGWTLKFTLISFSLKWFPHILNILTAFRLEMANLKLISSPRFYFYLIKYWSLSKKDYNHLNRINIFLAPTGAQVVTGFSCRHPAECGVL